MAREIEQLREPKHDRTDRLLDAIDLDGVGANHRRWNRQCGKDQRIAMHQRRIDLGSQRSANTLGFDVRVGRDVSSHLQPFTHAG